MSVVKWEWDGFIFWVKLPSFYFIPFAFVGIVPLLTEALTCCPLRIHAPSPQWCCCWNLATQSGAGFPGLLCVIWLSYTQWDTGRSDIPHLQPWLITVPPLQFSPVSIWCLDVDAQGNLRNYASKMAGLPSVASFSWNRKPTLTIAANRIL